MFMMYVCLKNLKKIYIHTLKNNVFMRNYNSIKKYPMQIINIKKAKDIDKSNTHKILKKNTFKNPT